MRKYTMLFVESGQKEWSKIALKLQLLQELPLQVLQEERLPLLVLHLQQPYTYMRMLASTLERN